METPRDRLFALIDAKYPEQKDFAVELGISASIISEWRRGKSKSFTKEENLEKIIKILETTSDYIMCGADSVPVSETGLSAEALELAAAFDRADNNVQDAVRAILRPFRKCEPSKKVM